jgi:dipeptidase E
VSVAIRRRGGASPTPSQCCRGWAADIGVPAYAIDEQTAIKVVDDTVEVVSEGQ